MHPHIRLFLLCFTAILLPCAHATNKPFTHPGILHTRAELEYIRSLIANKTQPQTSELQRIKDHPWAAIPYRSNAHKDIQRGPYNNPSIGANEFMTDGAAAYTHALLWWLTEEKTHADTAIAILDDYSKTLKSISNHDAKLLVGMGGIHFVNAAELIKHSSANWPHASQQRFASMLSDTFYPLIKDFFPAANGNWDASMLQTSLAIAVYLDDHEIFQNSINYFLNGQGNGSINNYFKPSGQCQESGRDQAHTQMGIGFLCYAAEIAWKQGVDLYSAAENRLAKGYEYTAKYNLGHDDVPFERYISYQSKYKHSKISNDSRGRFSPIYQLAFHHYHSRKGIPMPYTSEAINKIRHSKKTTTFTPWSTLMFTKLPTEKSP